MKRTALRKVGKIGAANIKANKILAEKLPKQHCEAQLEGCLGNWPLSWAHKHKRIWYKGDVEKLSDTNEVIVMCQNCHDMTEHNRKLNDEVFARLRPE